MTTRTGFKFIDHLAGQGQQPQAQTRPNSNAPIPQAAIAGSTDGAIGYRPARYRAAKYSSSSPTNLFFSTASEPLLPSQLAPAAPKTFEEYSTHWDAWKNEAHPITENRSEAVKRMKTFLRNEILVDKATSAIGSNGLSLLFTHSIPSPGLNSKLDLSSLGLSSLPPWLPKVHKLNLENNNLTSFPDHLITHQATWRECLGNQREIHLANNPISPVELNKLQGLNDSPDYKRPILVLPREGQRYEPPQ